MLHVSSDLHPPTVEGKMVVRQGTDRGGQNGGKENVGVGNLVVVVPTESYPLQQQPPWSLSLLGLAPTKSLVQVQGDHCRAGDLWRVKGF